MELKTIIGYGMVCCLAFYAGYVKKADFDEYWQKKNFPNLPVMKVVYEKNAQNPFLWSKNTEEKLEILVGEEGIRVGSIDYRLECLEKEAENKKTAEQGKNILLNGASAIEHAVYRTIYADRTPAKGFLQNYCSVRKIVSLNQNGEVETYLTNGKETMMLTEEFQLGTQWDRIKGLYCENKERISRALNTIKTFFAMDVMSH